MSTPAKAVLAESAEGVWGIMGQAAQNLRPCAGPMLISRAKWQAPSVSGHTQRPTPTSTPAVPPAAAVQVQTPVGEMGDGASGACMLV